LTDQGEFEAYVHDELHNLRSQALGHWLALRNIVAAVHIYDEALSAGIEAAIRSGIASVERSSLEDLKKKRIAAAMLNVLDGVEMLRSDPSSARRAFTVIDGGKSGSSEPGGE
jgi:hypothetical protein